MEREREPSLPHGHLLMPRCAGGGRGPWGKRVFVLRSIANSPPGLHCRDKSSEVRRGESTHTSPLEAEGCVSLVGSLVQAQEAPEKGLGAVKARALSAPALSCCDA